MTEQSKVMVEVKNKEQTTEGEKVISIPLNLSNYQIQYRAFDFEELREFRKEIETENKGLNLHFYTTTKHNVKTYRFIFGFMAVLFAVLAYLAFKSNPSALSQTFFENTHLLKNCFVTFATFLSVLSTIICVRLNSEIEAMRHIVQKAKLRLHNLYEHEKATLGRWYLLFASTSQKFFRLRRVLHDVEDKIEHYKHDFKHLIHQVRKNKQIDRAKKDRLFHQALLELHYKLMDITHHNSFIVE
jgi:hypothetical protein